MSDSDSEVSLCDASTTPGKWTSERIRLLIQLRLEMETQFRSGRSRHLLWPQIYNKLKSADPSMTETLKNVQKKFNNLMLTYKRINSSPRNINQSRWEFFEDFHDILSQFDDVVGNENQPKNVHYIQMNKIDDDSVSFSSDDGDDGPSRYKNVVFQPKPASKPTITYNIQSPNGIKTERLTVEEPDTKKRKLSETVCPTIAGKSQKRIKATPLDPTEANTSWLREYVKMNERREQLRYEQHEKLLELERKRIEIETKNGAMLSELLDIVKKFVNKSD